MKRTSAAYFDSHKRPALGENVASLFVEGYVMHDASALPR